MLFRALRSVHFCIQQPVGKKYVISWCLGRSTVKPDKQQINQSSSFDASNNWILQNGLKFIEKSYELVWPKN